MKAYNNSALTFLVKLILAVCLLPSAGYSQSNHAVMGSALTDNRAVLQELKITGEGNDTKVEIGANLPLTYTNYTIADPPQVVVDLSLTDPGSIKSFYEVKSTIIKSIEILKNESAGKPLTRVIIKLVKPVEFNIVTDPSSKSQLILSVVKQTEIQKNAIKNKEDMNAFVTKDSAKESTPGNNSTPVAKADKVVNSKPEKSPNDALPSPATVSASHETKTSVSPLSAEPNDVKPIMFVKSDPPVADSRNIDKAVTISTDGIEISSTGRIDKYKYFKLSNPQRLVIDIYDVKANTESKVVPINKFGVLSARIGSHPGKMRIVLDSSLKAFPQFKIEKADKGLKVNFTEITKEEKQEESIKSPLSSEPVKEVQQIAKAKSSSIEAVDFKIVDGYSRVSIKINGECSVSEPVKTADGLVFTLHDCTLPNRLKRSLDTRAFNSTVKKVTPYQVKAKGRLDTRILVRLRHDSPYTLKREGDLVTMDIQNPEITETPNLVSGKVRVPAAAKQKPKTESAKMIQEPQAAYGKKVYTGRRITLEFADADIRKIFQLIAEVSNLNFLLGDDVTGTISIKLVNVPWDQALEVILETKNLGMKREGNIVLIRPISKMQTLADEQLAEKKASERGMELRTKVFDINFAAVSDIATQFNSLKSDRGIIAQDSRTNRVIVTDIAPAIEKMTNLLAALDIPEKQVMIEARIVEASSTFTRDLGIQWGIHYKDGSASFLGINQLDTGFGGIVTNTAPTSGLPAATSAGGAMGLSFGKLTNNIQIDLRLSAAAENGQVKIISTPKVVTLNNKAAKISQGQSIPYQTTSAEGTKTEFVEAALTLEVTPHITSDGNVSMKIKASNNSAGAAPAGIPPPINKKEATTELLVKNGETTVIGGIYVDNDTSSDSGVPYLKDIPLLGWLFKSNNKSTSRTELLIFITPKIVS